MLDLNLARAAKRSFCGQVGEKIGKNRGQVASQQMFEHLLCEPWEQGGVQASPTLPGLTHEDRPRQMGGRKCSRQREECGQRP